MIVTYTLENHQHFFEITTTLALWYFKIKKCDFVVLETGLGGTYDCTKYSKSCSFNY